MNDDYAPIKLKDYYCAVLDILGYSDSIKDLFEKIEDDNKIGREHDTDHFINKILNALDKSGIEKNAETPTSDNIKTWCFSDTIFLIIEKDSSPNSLSSLLSYVGFIIKKFQEEGLYLRGGISCSKCAVRFDGNYTFIAGNALIKAHEIETNVAINPCVVIDEKILNEEGECIRHLGFWNNDQFQLDFAQLVFSDLLSEQRERKAISILNRVKEEILRPRKDPNVQLKVRLKYEWLLSYYLWFVCRKKIVRKELLSEFVHLVNPTSKFTHLRDVPLTNCSSIKNAKTDKNEE